MQNWGGKCLPPATLGWYGPGPLPQRGLLLLVAGPYRKPRRVGADSCSVDNRRGGRCQRGAQGWAVSPVWVCTWVCNCACAHVHVCTGEGARPFFFIHSHLWVCLGPCVYAAGAVRTWGPCSESGCCGSLPPPPLRVLPGLWPSLFQVLGSSVLPTPGERPMLGTPGPASPFPFSAPASPGDLGL